MRNHSAGYLIHNPDYYTGNSNRLMVVIYRYNRPVYLYRLSKDQNNNISVRRYYISRGR